MAKSTRTLSGQSQRKFFRELFRADPGVAPEAATRLTEACAAEIANVRVRLPLVVRRSAKGAVPVAPKVAAGEVGDDFDPHAFSLVVILRKGGKDGLLSRLAGVGDVAQLRAIAKAQHVAVDPALVDREGILAAIIAGTERRVADRQAAGS